MPQLDTVQRVKKPQRLPGVLYLYPQEVRQVLSQLDGKYSLAGNLLYGAGLRLVECLRLRVRDIEFDMHPLCARGGKGNKNCMTILPETVVEPLKAYLESVRIIHRRDLEQ